MHNIIGKKSLRCLAGGALMVFAGLSHAQYLWLNEKGAKVYSDRPPPSSVPLKNILKQPHGAPAAAEAAPGSEEHPKAAPEGAAAKAAPKGPPTLAERNADFKKRQTEKAEQEKKTSAEAAQKAEKKANCDIARNYKQSLDSGQRMGVTEANGERGYMSDEKRAEATARTNKTLQDCQQ